jgi:hypothetical protein
LHSALPIGQTVQVEVACILNCCRKHEGPKLELES